MLSLPVVAAIAGDALSDLRTTLTQLAATAPAHGTFEVDGAAQRTVGRSETGGVSGQTGARRRDALRKSATLKLLPRLSKAESKHVKKIETTLSVWLGEDGVPLAAERKMYIKASFMPISFEQNRTEKWDYAPAADRLIAVRYEENEKSDGFGQHNISHAVEVVRLEP